MKNKLSKNYQLLNSKERINLSIAAFARGDDEEFLILKNKCPVFYYKIPAANYTIGMEKIAFICMYYANLCELYSSKAGNCYLLISNLEELISVYENGFYLALKDLDNGYEPSNKIIAKKNKTLKEYELLINKMEKCYQKRTAELKAIHEAFKSFCEKAGINHQYAYGLAERLGDFELSNIMDFDNIEADAEFKEQIEKIFLGLWGK